MSLNDVGDVTIDYYSVSAITSRDCVDGRKLTYKLSVHLHFYQLNFFSIVFFPSMFFCGEATKKTSIDGLKWRDLVMVVWVGGGW